MNVFPACLSSDSEVHKKLAVVFTAQLKYPQPLSNTFLRAFSSGRVDLPKFTVPAVVFRHGDSAHKPLTEVQLEARCDGHKATTEHIGTASCSRSVSLQKIQKKDI